MSLFKGLIKCKDCGKKYKVKKERGKIRYICSGYDNYGSNFCKRHVIHEENLIEIVEKHISINNKSEDDKNLNHYIRTIEVENEEIKIVYFDDTFSFWGREKLIY